jgi:hypothetical protein
METKCSRSVLFEYSKTLEHIPKWNLRLKMKTTGIRWWHLFPLSEKSLTEKLFGINLTQIFSKNSTIKK